MSPAKYLRVRVFFAVLLYASGMISAAGQSRLGPFAALGVVHDALGRQESDFLSFPVIGAGVIFRLSRTMALGLEGEYARLGRFVSATEVAPGDPFNPVVQKYYSTATSWRLGLLALFRLGDRPLIPRLMIGAGYYRTTESAVARVRSEHISNGIGINLGVGWPVASLGSRTVLSLEGRWHLGVGEGAGEVVFTSFFTAGLSLTF